MSSKEKWFSEENWFSILAVLIVIEIVFLVNGWQVWLVVAWVVGTVGLVVASVVKRRGQ